MRPCIYHLRLLAFTHQWRTAENQRLLIESLQRLIDLSPLPNIYVRYKPQLITPASFCMDDFNPDVSALADAHWMMWFHRLELLSRLGVVRALPALAQQNSQQATPTYFNLDYSSLCSASSGQFRLPLQLSI